MAKHSAAADRSSGQIHYINVYQTAPAIAESTNNRFAAHTGGSGKLRWYIVRIAPSGLREYISDARGRTLRFDSMARANRRATAANSEAAVIVAVNPVNPSATPQAAADRTDQKPTSLLRRRAEQLAKIIAEREPRPAPATPSADRAPTVSSLSKHREGSSRPAAPAKLRADNAAHFDGDTLVLPGFSLFESGGHAPHRQRTIETFIDNRGTKYTLAANWPRTRWWLSAAGGGFRASNTASTGSQEIAERWEKAVREGRVRTADPRKDARR